jgi:hypothetical protein
MDNFNLKQYLFESRVGMYSKAVLNEAALLDAETLAKEIAKQHPEIIRYHHDGETRKFQDAIFKSAGEILHNAGIPLQTVRGLAYDADWAMELVSNTKSALEHGEGSLQEDSGRFYLPTYLATKLGSEEIADEIVNDFQKDHESEEDPEGDNARDYLLSIGTAEEAEEVLVDYISNYLNEVNPAALGAPQAAADAKMQQQDDQNGDMVDNVSMGLEEENPMEAAYGNVGSVDKVKPAETSISKYLDVLNAYDWFHHFADDPRAWNKGQSDKANLRTLYSAMTPNEKQQAMDTYVDKYLQLHDPKQFPNAANNVKYLTTSTFKGAI